MKKIPILQPILLGCSLFVLGSCGPVLYVPNTLNTPLLAKKGDFKGSIGVVGMAPEANVELQGSYAPTNKLAVKGNFFIMNGRASHRLIEGGAGTYTSFWKNKRGTDIGRAEVFGGAGFGSGSDDDSGGFTLFKSSSDRYTGNYQRIFLQPATGIRSRIVDISVATRIAYVHFSDFMHFSNDRLLAGRSFGFSTIEPVLTLSLGYKSVKFYMQMGSVSSLGNANDYRSVTNFIGEGGHFNVGLAGCPWHEKPLEKPPVALGEKPLTRPAGEAAKPEKMEQGEAPPTIVPISGPSVTICLRDAGSPDGDVVSISFNGAFIFENLELGKKWDCAELEAVAGADNLLHLHTISEGKFKHSTVQVAVKEGGSERTFYLRMEEGQVEEVRFRSGG